MTGHIRMVSPSSLLRIAASLGITSFISLLTVYAKAFTSSDPFSMISAPNSRALTQLENNR